MCPEAPNQGEYQGNETDRWNRLACVRLPRRRSCVGAEPGDLFALEMNLLDEGRLHLLQWWYREGEAR